MLSAPPVLDRALPPPAPEAPRLTAGRELSRDHVLARIDCGRPNAPTLVVVGGIHGNEPAGLGAIERVLATLRHHQIVLDGNLLALAGNLSALAAERRYLDRDLNRAWVAERVEEVRALPVDRRTAEDREQLELLRVFEELLASSSGELFVVDLHTTSGDGVPFGNMADTLRNRSFALRLPVPIIVGLEEELAGTMLDYLESRGFVTLGFEGGQHQAATSVDHSEAAIWIALEAAGLLPTGELVRAAAAHDFLTRVSATLPRVLEVRYRHAITPEDEFKMDPGYRNFQPVERGEELADDRRGRVRSPETGRLLMPLYQKLGDDGFFLIREFRPLWLKISTAFRRLRLDRAVRLFPGVHTVPGQPESVDVDKRVARWFALEVFHLLGYRRHRRQGDRLVLSRRREHSRRRTHRA